MATGTPIISVMEWNGDSVKTDKSSSIIRFKGADDAVVNSTNPLTIPGSGRTYSFEKWLRLRIGSGDPAQQLSNIKFYTDGGNSFGGNVFLFGEVSASDTFRSASLLSTNNNPPQGGSGSRSMTTVFRLTAGSALSLTSAAETFSGTSTDIGKFVVMCMRVDPGATAGGLSAETLSFSYDTSAMAVATSKGLAVNLNAAIAQTFTATTGFDGLTGDASADGPYTVIAGIEAEFAFSDLLDNDFSEIGLDDTDKAIVSIASVLNGTASIGESQSILFTASASGTCAVNYIGSYAGSTDTGSIAITAIQFPDTALQLPFFALATLDPVVEQRTGHVRATGFDIFKQIVSYDSGEERYTADLSSGLALGITVEDTGGNMLTNSALSGAGATNPTGWLSNIDGTRSGTASLLGNADGAQAYVQTAFSVTLGGPGGRPFLGQTLSTFSTSQTFVASMIVEYFTGQATAIVMGLAGFGSATGTQTVTAGQLLSLPQRVSMSFMNINSATDKTTGTVRYGLGVNSSTSSTLIMSRPYLEKKSDRLSFTPDSLRNPDMPIVTVSHSASASWFPFSTAQGSFTIQAKTAPTLSGTQVLMQLDATTAGNKQLIYRSANGSLTYQITKDSVNVVNMTWPDIISVATTFRLEASYGSGSAVWAVNGATACGTVAASIVMPTGLSILRIGHDLSGNQWNGTIAETNFYRTPSSPGITGGGGSTGGGSGGGGGTGGGGGGDPGGGAGGGNVAPLSYYGVGHQMISLANTTMNVAGRQIIFRVQARKTGIVSHVKWYLINGDLHPGDTGTPYSKYQGVAGLFGGLFRTSIWSNNPTKGTAGTAANVPSVNLGYCKDWTAHDHSGLSFPEQSCSITVSQSHIYHIMFQNIDPNPGNNYMSTDCIRPAKDSARVPHNPSISDLYDSVYYRNSSINTWSFRPQTPIYQLRYSDNTYQGVPYVESVLNTTKNSAGVQQDEGRVSVGGSTQVRQIFMPHENCTVTQFNIVAHLTGSPSALSIVTRQQSGNVLIDSTNKTVATVNANALTDDDWIGPVTLSSGPLVLSSSRTYVTTLTAATGTWQIASIRDATLNISSADGGAFDETIGVTGRCEKSTNGGTSWTGFRINYNTNQDNCDLMFYYTRTA